MIDFIRTVLDHAGQHVVLLLVCVLVFAAVDAALGVGAILPGETAVVFAAMALADSPAHIAAAVASAAAGAFIGDHIGFAIGRASGDRLAGSRLIGRLGRHRWDDALGFVARRFWVVIVARLLPGVRTLVSAAAGASGMPYPRFAWICAVAASIWAAIWVIGGALVGNAFLTLVEHYTVPALAAAAAAVVVAALVARGRRRHA